MARRTGDGSDEPWGLVALLTIILLVWADYGQLKARPQYMSLLLAGGLSVAAALSSAVLPPMICAALAIMAVVALLHGLLPAARPRGALAIMALLVLPVTASLNFYLGYPLRWICAHGAGWLLNMGGWQVTPEGAALLWNGKTILVDAPCAGIAMLWVGLFTAALLSYFSSATTQRTALNLVMAGLVVMAANILRNALLFFKEAGIVQLPGWTHEFTGLAVVTLALWSIYLFIYGRQHA